MLLFLIKNILKKTLLPTKLNACSRIVKHTKSNLCWGLSGRVLDSRPHWRHCVVVLEQDTFILA